MATEEAKTIYKQRAATAETVNADAKSHRGRVWIFSGGRNRRPDGTLREFLRSLGAS
jgi:hypothetical protein